ncbi:MAG TPA: DUF4157 domain-containing protein [Polyangia bacterium]|nr:DUF4157 domain-containing protein [Polyangia bacterium]
MTDDGDCAKGSVAEIAPAAPVVSARDFLDACTGGLRIPGALRRFSERSVGFDPHDVRISVSSRVETVNAAAVAVGDRIAVHPSVWRGFDDQRSLHLLFHELAHVAQQRAGRLAGHGGGLVVDGLLESEAELVADRAVRQLALSNAAPLPMLGGFSSVPGWFDWIAVQAHPGSTIIRRAMSWLEKRSAKAISKHIAKHATRNFSKAVHGVFRSIDKIRPLIAKTLQEGAALAERFAEKTGAEAVEEAGVKITRQTTGTPGKFRWLIQKQFSKEIGTKGETVLRVVLDMSGRIVTAFPADKILAILITVGAVEALTEGIADAAEKVAAEANRIEQIKERERNKIDLWEFVPVIGDIWGGSLNQFEDMDLAYDRFVDRVVNTVITAAEQRAGASPANREELEDIVRCGIGLPMMLENPF